MSPKKIRMGRPPLPKGEAKSVVLALRLTVSESRMVQAAAKQAGLAPSQWARLALVRSAQ
jgi:hypothetical protein